MYFLFLILAGDPFPYVFIKDRLGYDYILWKTNFTSL